MFFMCNDEAKSPGRQRGSKLFPHVFRRSGSLFCANQRKQQNGIPSEYFRACHNIIVRHRRLATDPIRHRCWLSIEQLRDSVVRRDARVLFYCFNQFSTVHVTPRTYVYLYSTIYV